MIRLSSNHPQSEQNCSGSHYYTLAVLTCQATGRGPNINPGFAHCRGTLLATVFGGSLSCFSRSSIFIIGTEMRVRGEDSLLRSRFGASFEKYRDSVRAYIPFVR